MVAIVTNKPTGCEFYRIRAYYPKTINIQSPTDVEIQYLAATTNPIVMHKDSYIPIFKEKMNKYIIVDVDDMVELPENHLLYKGYQSVDASTKYRKLIKEADLVTTTNKYLKEYLETITDKPIIINPNTVQLLFKPELPLDRLRIGYTGGTTHINDLMLIQGITKDIKRPFTLYTFSDKFDRILGGYRSTVLKPIPVGMFLPVYNKFNVAIAPLEDNQFNRLKSNLKFIEAAFTKTLFIGQNIQTYGEVIHGETGYLFDNKKQLADILNSITMEDIVRITDNAFKYVSDNYDIDTLRVNLYNNIQEEFTKTL